MKRCAHCKEYKEEDAFAFNNRILKIRQKHCRDCMRDFNRQSYERRTPDKKEQVRLDKQRRIEEARQFAWDYLSNHPCVDCGEANPVVLEFDHVRGVKRKEVANMVRLGFAIAAIQDEISKCEVRCANCHRIKTNKERGWFSG
jgi:hypothetical protein